MDNDPIEEADVLLAYGRDAEAREVLERAAARSPDRADIRARLASFGTTAQQPVTVKVRSWWVVPGVFLGAGLWIAGVATRRWWLLPPGLILLVGFLYAESHRQRRDPRVRALQRDLHEQYKTTKDKQ